MRKTSTRLIAMLICLTMVLSMLPMVAMAEDTTTAATTIYVQPNSNWLTDGARFAAYFFGNGETWVDCVDAGDGLYSVEVPAGYPSVIFCRMNPNSTANNWDNKWNQTKDLTVPTDNKVVYVVDGWNQGAGQWIEKGGDLEEIEVVYYLRGDMNAWGTNHPMTKNEDGTYSVTISLAAGTYSYKAADEGWGANWGEGGAGGANLSITVDEDTDVTFTLDTVAGTVTHDYVPTCTHEWGEPEVVTAPTCTEAGENSIACTLCGVTKTESVDALGHSYVDGICSVCGAEKPVLNYYLIGFINGADYGCEGDYENMGEYLFVDGTLVATFTADSYLFIKTEGNANWYMAEAYCDDTTCTFVEGGSEKMFAPGGVELTFTLVENADGSLTLSYEITGEVCEHPSHNVDGICLSCFMDVPHTYEEGICTVCGAEEPAPVAVEYYLAGDFNDWNAGAEDYKMMQLGEVYYISLSLVAGTYEFKITDGSWESGNAWPSSNYVLEVPVDSENISIMFTPSTGAIDVSGVNQPVADPSELALGDNNVTLGVYTFTATQDGLLNIVVSAVAVLNPETGEYEAGNPGMVFGRMYTLLVNGETNFMPENQIEVVAGDVVSIELSGMGGDVQATLNLAYEGVEVPAPDYYLIGYINGANYGCEEDYENLGEYKFIDGTLVATFTADSYVFLKTGDNAHWFMSEAYCQDTTCTFIEGGTEKMIVPGNVELTFSLVVNEDGTLTLSYEITGEICEHPSHTVDGICPDCGATVDHTYVDGICSICGAEEPVPEYYVAGSFNDWNAAAEGYKMMQLGEVYYISISLTAGTYEFKITDGSWESGNAWPSSNYVLEVPVDSENISIMFYPDSGEIEVSGINQPVEEPTELVLGDNNVGLGAYTFTATEAGKLNIVVSSVAILNPETGEYELANPGMIFGRMFTLSVNGVSNFMPENQIEVAAGDVVSIELAGMGGDAQITLNLSYQQPAVVPTLTLNYPTLAFEAEILYNAYFTVQNGQDVVEYGMITFDSRLEDGTVDDAIDMIPGCDIAGNYRIVSSNGVPAKNLGDALYFKVYALLSDGTYAYSDVAGYNAVAYAKTILNSASSTDKAKALVVAMLNYGAAAQVYFDYNADNLMNASLTAEQQALVEAYDESMVNDVTNCTKPGIFTHNGGYTKIYPTVSFQGAFAINYYFATKYTPDYEPIFYYWDSATYNSVDELTADNCTGALAMIQDGTQWTAAIEGIAAKSVDETYYVAAVYYVGDTAYTSPVIAYSLGKYCETVAAGTDANGAAFGGATAVYGFYAKAYFA
ncbi:MAG: hypothetical protein IJB11_06950 [Oscillospiraceae bacterium]|nr:hypothetical protein [Oscillospiraceae bacterium]